VSEAVPFASVVVVCWNSADVLGRCLDQLLVQDYPDYEIIVVDDGSEDDTVEVAQDMLGSGKLTIVRSPLNRGCPHARNIGLRHASGEIIGFIDADGYARPTWLRYVVAAFEADSTIGGVASTVFMEANPLVLNGAGGIINRQGWAADLSINVPYERADIVAEALYPMGCGMAVRRTAVERVGPFDDRMLNYYDDVDYGIRLWRAGYRVVVAPDAWIDHGFRHTGGDSSRKQLLCEQHRIRVVLTHTSGRALPRWAAHEALATMQASWPRREVKRKAIRWNAQHLGSTLLNRWRLRGAPRPRAELFDPSWGEAFPQGVPPWAAPNPESACAEIDMADPNAHKRLSYGWFPMETINGRSYRWAGVQAAAMIHLPTATKKLRLEYAQVPYDTGGVTVSMRQLGSDEPLTPVWSTHLHWQYIERCVENHPLALPASDYEIVFSTREAWSDPPSETRPLGFALASVAFEESFEIGCATLDIASPATETQLVRGWFETEGSPDRVYRWASAHASAVVRLHEDASRLRLRYCLPPASIDGVKVMVQALNDRRRVWSTRIAWGDGAWHDDDFPLHLAAGDYLVSFDAETTWSNPEGRDRRFAPENRSLGFALSLLSFEPSELRRT
jgi:GT2 family glycosyltransferase